MMDTAMVRRQQALLVHINAMKGITPLVGGYLKAYAFKDEDIQSSWQIELLSVTIERSVDEIVAEVLERCGPAPSAIGFSTYVWNIKLVQGALEKLRSILPKETVYILGGVEAMNRAEELITPDDENILICNGEGEITFCELLNEINKDSPDFTRVGGISFYQNGELVHTPDHKRIKSLDEIPSPFLAGYFEPQDMAIALLETNRGCPYQCSYCFWGGAVGQKINRISKTRIEQEIEYLGQNNCRSVLLCDANFGIFPNDVEHAKQFVAAKKKYGFPMRVRYSSAKNNLERSLEIASILAEGDVLTCQPISLQTLSPVALKKANRDNIDLQTYFGLQKRTNELGISSFIEIIWPLPGETLASFKDGLAQLCRRGAQAFAVYPLLWLNNVGFQGQEQALGVQTWKDADESGSGRNVIATKEVPFDDYLDGLMYAAALQVLHDARTFDHTLRLLDALGSASIRSVCDLFVTFIDAKQGVGGFAALWEEGRDRFRETRSNITWPGSLVFHALHEDRAGFDSLLREFVSENRALFSFAPDAPDGIAVSRLIDTTLDFDLLARPYVYNNTPMRSDMTLKHMIVKNVGKRAYDAQGPIDIEAILQSIQNQNATGQTEPLGESNTAYRFDHSINQGFLMASKSREDHFDECRLFATEIGNFSQTWQTAETSNSLPTHETERA
ncbi:Radical SAM superfamily protein [Pseudovibrio axinellae]|uniref:Radical SAM superfamily protein n=1 Tax=Pseudovibrio axinellae TaxID=989403 RepID=A0A165U0S1_9HYPH|nr:radical SAM protein [Pseudovibrio axinellae]KZL09106.1 Radical SAM superfamily protein [Pseudovibrio axinellae]SER75521.1 hypothetical protein SAMN05421798_12017 [Pseudovibrio axinellae]